MLNSMETLVKKIYLVLICISVIIFNLTAQNKQFNYN